MDCKAESRDTRILLQEVTSMHRWFLDDGRIGFQRFCRVVLLVVRGLRRTFQILNPPLCPRLEELKLRRVSVLVWGASCQSCCPVDLLSAVDGVCREVDQVEVVIDRYSWSGAGLAVPPQSSGGGLALLLGLRPSMTGYLLSVDEPEGLFVFGPARHAVDGLLVVECPLGEGPVSWGRPWGGVPPEPVDHVAWGCRLVGSEARKESRIGLGLRGEVRGSLRRGHSNQAEQQPD